MTIAPNVEDLNAELEYTTSRSSGPGGQNVNKVESRVTLRLDIVNSKILTPEQKEIIGKKLSGYISREGVLQLNSQSSRSQKENKDQSFIKLGQLLSDAFRIRKARKKSTPGKAAKQKRLKSKKLISEKKLWRKKPE